MDFRGPLEFAIQDCTAWLADTIETRLSSELSRFGYKFTFNQSDDIRSNSIYITVTIVSSDGKTDIEPKELRISDHCSTRPSNRSIDLFKGDYAGLKLSARKRYRRKVPEDVVGYLGDPDSYDGKFIDVNCDKEGFAFDGENPDWEKIPMGQRPEPEEFSFDSIVVDERISKEIVDIEVNALLKALDFRTDLDPAVIGVCVKVSRRSSRSSRKRAEQRAEVVGNLSEGQAVEGVVKNITEYGAFVDLGGVDGLLHVTDMAWRRVSQPSEILTIGETIKVQIIKINKETHRISLGMKQLQEDPWNLVTAKYPLGAVHQGVVTNITDYGAFVELEAGVEGLVHVSEMSWTKKNVHPGKIVSTSQEVDVMVLEIDSAKRRVSLGLKQTQRNPWEVFTETHPGGTEVEGEVKNITEFGLFIGLDGDIDGMVHLSDLSLDKRGEDAIQTYRKGDVVQAIVSEVDVEKERILLSIKALGG